MFIHVDSSRCENSDGVKDHRVHSSPLLKHHQHHRKGKRKHALPTPQLTDFFRPNEKSRVERVNFPNYVLKSLLLAWISRHCLFASNAIQNGLVFQPYCSLGSFRVLAFRSQPKWTFWHQKHGKTPNQRDDSAEVGQNIPRYKGSHEVSAWDSKCHKHGR